MFRRIVDRTRRLLGRADSKYLQDRAREIETSQRKRLDQIVFSEIPTEYNLNSEMFKQPTYSEVELNPDSTKSRKIKAFSSRDSPNPALSESDFLTLSKGVSTPTQINIIQELLSGLEKKPILVTSIEPVRQSSKNMYKAWYMKINDDNLYPVMIFDADPKITKKEMVIYHVGFMHDVLTPAPLGYVPDLNGDTYPHPVGLLKPNLIEFSGLPYKNLIQRLRIPKLIHEAGINVVKMIADTQAKLTFARSSIEAYGVHLEDVFPDYEIRRRMLPGINKILKYHPDNRGARLISENNKFIIRLGQLYNIFYKSLDGRRVVSHEDESDGNILTKEIRGVANTKQFGTIDWEYAGMDFFESDIVDFFVHHRREAMKANSDYYNYKVEDFLNVAVQQFNKTSTDRGSDFKVQFRPRNLTIQKIYWNTIEMFDHSRTNFDDIKLKAIYHGLSVMEGLKDLQRTGNANDRETSSEIIHSFQYLFSAIPELKFMEQVFGNFRQTGRPIEMRLPGKIHIDYGNIFNK
jgi:hypothetical protein